MTRIRIVSLLSTLPAFALAAIASAADGDWRIYSKEANGNVHFFDTLRVQEDAHLRKIWQRIRYKGSVMGASSYQALLEVDCAGRTQQVLQRTFFSDKNWENPAMSTDTKAKQKRRIAEGSAAARLSEIVCNQ